MRFCCFVFFLVGRSLIYCCMCGSCIEGFSNVSLMPFRISNIILYQFICREVSTISTPSVALQHPHGNSSSSSSSSGYRIHSGNMMTPKPAPTSVQQSHMGVRPQVPHYMTMGRSGIPENKIVFKSSPFYKDIQVLSPARLCIGNEPRNHFCERKSRTVGNTERGRGGHRLCCGTGTSAIATIFMDFWT